MNRIAIFRDTFPRTNPVSGAAFRTEVAVCSACHHVVQTSRLAREIPCYNLIPVAPRKNKYGKVIAEDLCLAPRFYPTAEIGWRFV